MAELIGRTSQRRDPRGHAQRALGVAPSSPGSHATAPAPVFEELSVLDLFKVGIGPSSSHTVGPMKAAVDFAERARAHERFDEIVRVKIELFGSLGATGSGHATDIAVMLGLSGLAADTVTTAEITTTIERIRMLRALVVHGERSVAFDEADDIVYRPLTIRPEHPNALRIWAYDEQGETILTEGYYSVGGGFVMRHDPGDVLTPVPAAADRRGALPFPFTTGDQLVAHCTATGRSIAEIMLANEGAWRDANVTIERLEHIWQVMQDCVASGCTTDGVLPGGLGVPRRAKDWLQRLVERDHARADGDAPADALAGIEWVNLFALAVNEENAAGHRVVTAPTNGAAGIIPAVMHYFDRFERERDIGDGLSWPVRFLLVAGAIGIIIKANASISGAEIGCQGEVGSACAMAAAGFAALLGSTPQQIENAAEIGIEHNLGLTCDPIGGLVQIPCIERNAMASVKAINAARMAHHGDGTHFVSLDTAVETMRATGADMSHKYKETALGGLAVAYIEC